MCLKCNVITKISLLNHQKTSIWSIKWVSRNFCHTLVLYWNSLSMDLFWASYYRNTSWEPACSHAIYLQFAFITLQASHYSIIKSTLRHYVKFASVNLNIYYIPFHWCVWQHTCLLLASAVAYNVVLITIKPLQRQPVCILVK